MPPTIDRTTLPAFHDTSGARIRKTARYVGPVSYTGPGGDPFTPADLGMTRIDVLLFTFAWDGANAHRSLVWDRVNQKVVWFVTSTDQEVANAVDLSGFTATFEAIGI